MPRGIRETPPMCRMTSRSSWTCLQASPSGCAWWKNAGQLHVTVRRPGRRTTLSAYSTAPPAGVWRVSEVT